MDLLNAFNKSISSRHLRDRSVLLAVSGGLDSVVLTELSHQAGLKFSIAHCNFRLRGEESDRDEAFVRELAARYGVDVFVKKIDTTSYATDNNLSIQEAARRIRYDFFAELVSKRGFAHTLLAHHANDQVETVLMNFFRGTGLEGLTGMPEVNQQQAAALRPLLNIKRAELESFARDRNLQWVEDSSNESSKYTRNFFRNEIIPQVKKVFPQVEDNIMDNVNRLQRTNKLYRGLTEILKKKICEQKGNELHLPILKLLQYRDTSLLFEIIRDYGFSEKQEEEIWKLTESESGKFISNNQYQVIRHRRWLIIAPVSSDSATMAINDGQDRVQYKGGSIDIRKIPIEKSVIDQPPAIANVDASELDWPLLLRRWKQGDYFYPLGMRKKKKVSRFLIDQKVSKSAKENTWVIESNKKIIWIVGYRIDDRFKVTAKTKTVLLLTLKDHVLTL